MNLARRQIHRQRRRVTLQLATRAARYSRNLRLRGGNHLLLVFLGSLLDALLFGGSIALGSGPNLSDVTVQLRQSRLNLAQTPRRIGTRRLSVLNTFLNRGCALAEGLRQFRFQQKVEEGEDTNKIQKQGDQKRSVGPDPQFTSPLLRRVRRLLGRLGQNLTDTGIAIAG